MSQRVLTNIVQVKQVASTCLTAASLAERVELIGADTSDTLELRGPDGFGFFGTVAFRSVRLRVPCTTRDVAIAVARFVLSEFWATDAEIADEKAKFPLALVIALQ
jgi:hypothetical protein